MEYYPKDEAFLDMVSSRTPEGFPSRCPLCGAQNEIEFSDPPGDAPCPNCGYLLWFSTRLLACCQDRVVNGFGVASEDITPMTTLDDLSADSLDVVELVMELEERFEVSIPDEQYQNLQTIGDVIRYIERLKRRNDGA